MAGYTKTSAPRLRFHAVTVIAGEDACMQARALKDIRLLSADAPRLPMHDCDQPDRCACKFQHHDDRRAGPRRSFVHAMHVPETGDRRRLRGRRATDFA